MILSLWNPYTAILVAILSLLLPRGLSFNWRTSKVDQTERIKRLNTVYFILISLISIASVLLEYGYFLALFANVFSFFVYDQALKLTKNFEKNQSQIFVDRAEAKLGTFSGPIVSITGSYSKTTTKNTLKQILSTTNDVFVTPESYNNRLGIAKSIKHLKIIQ